MKAILDWRRATVAILLSCCALFGTAVSTTWIGAPAHASEAVPSTLSPNEAIGTLPGYWVDESPWTWYFWGLGGCTTQAQVALTAYVPKGLIHQLVEKADGHGFVLLDHTGKDDQVRMRFFGDIRVGLAVELLVSGAAHVSSSVGAAFAGGEAAFLVGERFSDSFTLPGMGHQLRVPVGLLLDPRKKPTSFSLIVASPSGAMQGVQRFDRADGIVLVTQDMP